jgi:hypothetical protein
MSAPPERRNSWLVPRQRLTLSRTPVTATLGIGPVNAGCQRRPRRCGDFPKLLPWPHLSRPAYLLARAQQPISIGQTAANPSDLTINIAPYVWFANINATANLGLPPALGGSVTTDTSAGFGDILSHLNFATFIAAEAQYQRFSLLTDFIYLNVGGAASQFRDVRFPGVLPIPISKTLETSQGLNMNAKIWTLAGGYTVMQADWGNLDAIVGFRYLGLPLTVNYSLALTLTGPRGNGATFGGVGGVSGTAHLWNGIGGFRGRIRLPYEGLFIPYYFDAGAGRSQFTWQISSGLGYHLGWGDLSLTYRYLSFEQRSTAVLQNLNVKGPQLMVNFSF